MKEASLTVKCLRDHGMFDIWPAQSVTFWPAQPNAQAGGEPARDRVEFEMPDGTPGSFDRGTVYVMNASGKTIETIRLMDAA
jgi:hypothetical protein